MKKIDVRNVDSIYIDEPEESKLNATKVMRVSEDNYEIIRKIAFERKLKMNEVLDALIRDGLSSNSTHN